MTNQQLIDKLNSQKALDQAQWVQLFATFTEADRHYAAALAREIADSVFGKRIYIRGLVEFSNYCKQDCYYCGIRCSNRNAQRYRLTKEDILSCCEEGAALGFRTFVLQSGEDKAYSNAALCDIVSTLKSRHPDCAVTLSLGELSEAEYRALFAAGADRYLLRHETADAAHYAHLHPANMRLESRLKCLQELKAIGFQTGCGMMIGSPYQTPACLAEDMRFLRDFEPHMVGVGPFLPHKDTPFKKEPAGSFETTLLVLSLVRIMLPQTLLPATTALGTVHPYGREEGILAGANVVMPNLSPTAVRRKYMLYDNKICTGDESAQCVNCLQQRLQKIGYEIVQARGDYGQSSEPAK
ncbi:MAG: [Clostridia bacterium]|nr:[FeFe] hydrogenase H-cluster radical SAM maturase HydE [Clostridia bacterium]